jgi:hypothetical protein
MEWNIDLADLKESAVRRMLREAITTQKNSSLPLHKRGKKQDDIVEDDDASETADEENEKLTELAAEKGEPKEIPMTNEDISEEAGEKLMPPKKMSAKSVVKTKLGKPYTPS